ncbi:MAG TPA: ferritin family protein [Dehalococcoidia bacterium]|jgi:rubrerythrin|nr:ferritin family protein [Dehalococcoidia bacterium]
MSIVFTGSELVEIAINIERNGVAFYQALANKTQNKDSKDIYDYLANEEKKHLNTFQGMLDAVGQYQPPQDYAEEYMLYLKSLVDSSVFSNISEAQQKAEKVTSEIEATDIGIQAEKDSILFYTEMQNFVRQPDQKVVLNIIDEEKAHLRMFSQLKKTLRKVR